MDNPVDSLPDLRFEYTETWFLDYNSEFEIIVTI